MKNKESLDAMALPPHYNMQGVLEIILNRYGSFIGQIAELKDSESLGSAVPSEWLKLRGCSKHQVIEALWGNQGLFPAFSDFLADHLLALFIAVGAKGPIMIYFLERFEHFDGEDYLDGCLIAGKPVASETLIALDETFGPIPGPLKRLWMTHGFFVPRNGVMVCSPDKSVSAPFEVPQFLGLREGDVLQKGKFECFSFANCWSDLPFCLVREQGQNHWLDLIGQAQVDGKTGYFDQMLTLDEFLTREF